MVENVGAVETQVDILPLAYAEDSAGRAVQSKRGGSLDGVAPHVAELCLGHVEKETMRRVYDGHDYSGEMADAWDRAGAHIAALRKGGAQVVELRGRTA